MQNIDYLRNIAATLAPAGSWVRAVRASSRYLAAMEESDARHAQVTRQS